MLTSGATELYCFTKKKEGSMENEETTVAEILRYFFFLESGREKFHGDQEKILQWRGLSDDEVLVRASKWLCERDDTNPVLVWTVGNRCGQVRR